MFHKFSGIVIGGKKLGRTINFPTANISLKKEGGIGEGTYAINGNIEGTVYRGVGVYRESIELFEAHFFDFDTDIYGKEIEIAIYDFIRKNMKFESVTDLQKQIEKDVNFAQNTEYNVLTFGTFDILHPGHEHYLNAAKMYGNTLITVVATEKNREKTTGNTPRNTLESRADALEKIGISDKIEKGSEDNPLVWLEKYKPKVICLGYDQMSFSKLLDAYSKDIDIIRLDAFHPEKFKSSKLK